MRGGGAHASSSRLRPSNGSRHSSSARQKVGMAAMGVGLVTGGGAGGDGAAGGSPEAAR